MTDLPLIYLARHGETAWTITGQHTGLTDLPLTERGERNAQRLGERLSGRAFGRVYSSPLQRATRTCELAGFSRAAIVDEDLVEWDYGEYEGRTSVDIAQQRPDWELFRDGCPAGETVDDVARRVSRVIARVREVEDDVLIFSSGHFLRVFAAMWAGLPPEVGRVLQLGTAAVSILGYHRSRYQPVIHSWNDCANPRLPWTSSAAPVPR